MNNTTIESIETDRLKACRNASKKAVQRIDQYIASLGLSPEEQIALCLITTEIRDRGTQMLERFSGSGYDLKPDLLAHAYEAAKLGNQEVTRSISEHFEKLGNE